MILQLREPAFHNRFRRQETFIAHLHLGWCGTGFFRRGLVHVNRRSFNGILQLDESLTGQRTVLVGGATGYPADDTTALVEEGVAIVGHTHAFFRESKPNYHALAGLFAGDEGLTPDEPG